MGVTAGLRRLWLAGGVLVAVGLLLPGGGGFTSLPGVAVLAVAAGVTAARRPGTGLSWLVLAWAVPVIPSVAAIGFFAWLVVERADPLAIVLVAYLMGGFALATWVVFLVALVVELVLVRRRRRFGDPPPAWENAPTPPSYS